MRAAPGSGDLLLHWDRLMGLEIIARDGEEGRTDKLHHGMKPHSLQKTVQN